MAKVRLQNQEFEIPETLITLDERMVSEKGEEEAKKQRDSNLKRWLSQVSPAATNATLTWSEETRQEGTKEIVVRVTPQLGTKGGYVIDTLMDKLHSLPQHIHPVIALSFELKLLQLSGHFSGSEALPCLLAYQERIQRVLELGSGEEREIGTIALRLREAKPSPSPWAPLGF